MKKNINRIVIYTPDIMRLTGRSERTVRRWIAAIKKNNKKSATNLITIEEFCEFTGYNEEKVAEFLQ